MMDADALQQIADAWGPGCRADSDCPPEHPVGDCRECDMDRLINGVASLLRCRDALSEIAAQGLKPHCERFEYGDKADEAYFNGESWGFAMAGARAQAALDESRSCKP